MKYQPNSSTKGSVPNDVTGSVVLNLIVTMEVIKVILGLFLALCSLAQADELKVVNALPKDQVQLSVTRDDSFVWLSTYMSQDSMEMKIEMKFTVLADQQRAISEQRASEADEG
jgi:hypothetical protein